MCGSGGAVRAVRVGAGPDAAAGVSSTTSTPKSLATPASPSAYPWPRARSFQSAPLRYSSARRSTVSRRGRGGVKRAIVRPAAPVTSRVGAGRWPNGVSGAAGLIATVRRVAPGRRAPGSTVRVWPVSRAPGAAGWL